MNDWRDYEFKVMLSELPAIERIDTWLAALLRRLQHRQRWTRIWLLDYIAPFAWLVG